MITDRFASSMMAATSSGDRQLVGKAVNEGDLDKARREFEVTVTPEVRRLLGLAMTIVRDQADAEDAVQDTLVSAWKSWAALRSSSQARPWLTRICVNSCIDKKRRDKRTDAASLDIPEIEPAAPRTPRMEGEMLDFDKVFGSLSAHQRAAFALHFHHGYTLDECAQMMGCRPGTARSHLGRAVATLRKELSDV